MGKSCLFSIFLILFSSYAYGIVPVRNAYTNVPVSFYNVGSNIGIGTSSPQSSLTVNGGGIAGELVNKGYELVIPSPTLANNSEVAAFGGFQGNLYTGYYSGYSGNIQADIYKWDGNKSSLFYQLGFGSDFQGVTSLQAYQGKLFAGSENNGTGSAGVYVYDPKATVTNYIQMTSSNSSTAAVTAPSTANNQLSGSTAYSAEFYGRVDDLGVLSDYPQMINKENSGLTAGFSFQIHSDKKIYLAIDTGAARKLSITNALTFTIGNYHDFIFSWTSGSPPIIYVDGVSVGLGTSASTTSPTGDTAIGMTFGSAGNSSIWGGTINRVRLWNNYALTSGDASSLAAGGSASQSPTGQYLFTEGSGTTTADSSGNGNTATIVSPAYWNNSLFTLSFNPGVDNAIQAMAVFKGKLYAGGGYYDANIYQFDGTTWKTVYTGPGGGVRNIQSIFVHKGILFAGTQTGNIFSSPDGINWTVETTVNYATGMAEFRGNLYASGYGTQISERNDATGTWYLVPGSMSGISQSNALVVYDNNLYVLTTIGGGAQVYKYDGSTFTLDFTNNYAGAQGTEAFSGYNYDGSMYIGMGYTTSTTADIWRKTDSLGQIMDWGNSFLNAMRLDNLVGYNWPDPASISVSSPVNFDSIIRTESGINWVDLSGYSNGKVLTATSGGAATFQSGGAGSNYWSLGSGGNVGINTTNNVGIGSANPGQILDVKGTARMTGFIDTTSPTNNYVMTSDANGNGTWQVGGVGSSQWTTTNTKDVYLPNNGNVGLGTTITNQGAALAVMNGNVGIGTWVPKGSLDVGATGTICLGGTCNSTWPAGGGASGWTLGSSNVGISTTNNVGIGTNLTTTAALTVMNGNVGIGTWVPNSKFNVIGTSINNSTGALNITQTALDFPAISVQGDYDSASGDPQMLVSGKTNTNEQLFFGYDTTNDFGKIQAIHQSVGFKNLYLNTGGGNVGVGGTSANKLFSVGSSTQFGVDTSGNISTSGSYTQSGSSVDKFSGNVGIGQAIPVNALDINGSVAIGSYNGVNTAPTNGLIVSGNVGIGSANPGQILDIKGTARMTGFIDTTSPTNNYVMTSDANGNGTWQASSGGGSSNWTYSSSGNVGLSTTAPVGIGTSFISTAGLAVMNGNVGIGTWVPGYSLDVEGGNSKLNGQVTVQSLLTTTGSSDFNINASGANNLNLETNSNTIENITSGGNVGIGGTSAATSPSMYIGANGNVGIGTIAPAAQLWEQTNNTENSAAFIDYNSSGRTITGVYDLASGGGGFDLRAYGPYYSETLFNNSMSGGAAMLGFPQGSSSFVIGPYGANPLVFGTNNTERMRLTGGGNFGINTNSPGYTLDVNGDINTSTVFRSGTTAGISTTITTAKLTISGSNGSMTFTGGILTSSTPAT